jgi:hypothetical protein
VHWLDQHGQSSRSTLPSDLQEYTRYPAVFCSKAPLLPAGEMGVLWDPFQQVEDRGWRLGGVGILGIGNDARTDQWHPWLSNERAEGIYRLTFCTGWTPTGLR